MGVKAELYNAIKSKIELDVTEIKTVNLFNSQIDNEDRERSRTYPIVDIHFAILDWNRTNQKAGYSTQKGNVSVEQQSNIIVTLHCQFEKYVDETDAFLEIEPILDKIYFAIQGLSGTYFTPLLRVAERQDVEHDNAIDWQMDYSSNLHQCGQDLTTTGDIVKINAGTLDSEFEGGRIDLDLDNQTIRTGDGNV